SRTAPRVHADPAVIARMEALCDTLEQDARIALRTDGGEWVRGVVSPQPTVQSFFDADGNEGINGVVKVETDDGGARYLWLDEVAFVEHLPNPSPPEAPDGHRPRDPNAAEAGR